MSDTPNDAVIEPTPTAPEALDKSPAAPLAAETTPDMSFEELIKRRDAARANYEQRLQVRDTATLAPGTSLARADGRGEMKPIDDVSPRVGRGVEGVIGALLCADTLKKFCNQIGVDYVAPEAVVFRCAGAECNVPVKVRGGYCEACVQKQETDRLAICLTAALRSVNPEGARSWCRRANPTFQGVMRRPAAPCSICAGTGTASASAAACLSCSGTGMLPPGLAILFERLPIALRTKEAALIVAGGWSRPMGGLVLVGPTESGKSALLSAIGIAILDLALAGKLDAEGFRFFCGMRRTTGFALSEARRKNKLGTEEDPPEIAMAKKATLLILDEIGYEDQSFDPLAVSGVLKARSGNDGPVRPTLLASGRTFAGLCERYGEANIRTVYQPFGRVIDLWQGVPGRD